MTRLESASVYRVQYGYVAAGAAIILSCLIAVASTFWGWWRLGRRITMSPVEIAKAFNAPVLQGDGLDSQLDGLLPIVGMRRVRYGEVKFYDGRMEFLDESVDDEGKVQRRLELSHLHWTSVPSKGSRYV